MSFVRGDTYDQNPIGRGHLMSDFNIAGLKTLMSL
jgi:hypothetical protein